MKKIVKYLTIFKKLQAGHIKGGLLLLLPVVLEQLTSLGVDLSKFVTPEIESLLTLILGVFGFSLVAKTDLKK